jgi:hypothetical protein
MLNFSSKGLKVNSKQADVIGTVKGLTRVSGWSESVTTDPVPPGEYAHPIDKVSPPVIKGQA